MKKRHEWHSSLTDERIIKPIVLPVSVFTTKAGAENATKTWPDDGTWKIEKYLKTEFFAIRIYCDETGEPIDWL